MVQHWLNGTFDGNAAKIAQHCKDDEVPSFQCCAIFAALPSKVPFSQCCTICELHYSYTVSNQPSAQLQILVREFV